MCNFSQTPCCDVIKRTLALEARKAALNSPSLLRQCLALRRRKYLALLFVEATMLRMNLDYRHRPILAMHESQEVLGRVARVSHDIPRMERLIGYARLPESVGCPSNTTN